MLTFSKFLVIIDVYFINIPERLLMDDLERYGDYNEIDEPPKKSGVLTVIKITAAVIIFSIIGLLAFRLFLFNHAPNEAKNLYFTENLCYNKI